jgi:hypothetical protein
MSDTSGRVVFDKPKKKIRIRLHDLKEAGQSPTARDVWEPLKKDVDLREAYVRTELTTHLKSFAKLIEIATSRGAEAVAKEFGVNEQSAFSTIQRNIRHANDAAKSTEYSGAADRAFQLGSYDWAAKLLGKGDPTKYKLVPLVAVIRRNPERALTLAANCVLQQYGERLLRSALPGGTTDNPEVETVLKDHRRRLQQFFRDNPDADAWGSATITATLRKYVNQLDQ